MQPFETVEVTTDLLICGGGMAACGAAVEAAYWAKKKGLKVTLVDKAAMDRSGAVAMGLSALNQYVGVAEGDNTPEEYVDYVRQDLMGITREDLVYDIARHVDSTVHLFEKWGLPIWKGADGKYVHEGRWQLMINGESYKIVVAEAAKNALGMENIYERVFIVEPLMDGDKIAGAVGFSTRENKFYVFKAKAVLAAMGGAVHVFRPRSVGEGAGRSWYPPFNSGSSAYFTIKAGAEMTCQEVRFIPVRFKDAYGPVGAWFLLFKSRATNALGEDYMVTHTDELQKWAPYGLGKPIPANLRNWLGMMDLSAGKGPIYMRTEEAIQKIVAAAGDEKAAKKKLKEARFRGVGRLPRYDHLPGHPVGFTERAAGREELRDHALRALLHRLPLRRLGRMGERSSRRGASGVLLGIQPHVHDQRPLCGGRRLRRFEPQVLRRLPRRREGLRRRPPWLTRPTTPHSRMSTQRLSRP